MVSERAEREKERKKEKHEIIIAVLEQCHFYFSSLISCSYFMDSILA